GHRPAGEVSGGQPVDLEAALRRPAKAQRDRPVGAAVDDVDSAGVGSPRGIATGGADDQIVEAVAVEIADHGDHRSPVPDGLSGEPRTVAAVQGSKVKTR